MSTIVNGNSRFLVAALMLMAGAGSAHAQTAATYPSRAIRIVVPFTPGGPNDILARTVGQKLSEAWGRQVIVENRPGGGTVIATELVANAAPEVPPVADTLAGFDATSWYGIFAPVKTPRDIVLKLNNEIVRALGTREMRERLAHDGSLPVGDTPEIFSAFFQGEVAKWAKVIRDVGLKSDI